MQCWLVEQGPLELFLVPLKNGEPDGPRHHLMRISTGGLVFGVEPKQGWTLLGVGHSETTVVPLATPALAALAGSDLAPHLADWLEGCLEVLRPGQGPSDVEFLSVGQTKPAGGALGSLDAGVWLRSQEGFALDGARTSLTTGPLRLVPADREFGWVANSGGVVSCLSSEEALQDSAFWGSLEALGKVVFEQAQRLAEQVQEKRSQQLETKVGRDQRDMTSSLTQMAAVLPGTGYSSIPSFEHPDPLAAAAALVASSTGIETRRSSGTDLVAANPVLKIAHAWRCQVRQVQLEGRWWRTDNGPLLASLAESGEPVALLEVRPGRYEAVNTVTRERQKVDEAYAARLSEQAWMFYRGLPDRALRATDLLWFGLSSTQGGLASLFWLGLGIGLLSLVMPMAIGTLVNTVIPAGNAHALGDLALALLAATLGTGAFNLTRSIVVLRLEGQMDGAVQSAIMDRVLRLPIPFFRQFSTGDLANRALGINAIRQILSGATISTLLSGLFSLFSFALLFYYDWKLACVATALVLILAFQIVFVGVLLLRYQRPMMDLEGELSGRVYQLLMGIAKIRVAGAETRAFAQWAQMFAEQRRLSFESGLIGVNSGAFQTFFRALTTAVLFAFIAWQGYASINTGHFLAFNAAFGQFLGALTSVSSTLTSVLKVGPIVDRARPILETALEVVEDKPDAAPLKGEVCLRGISFRYHSDQPWVLDKVSLEAKPGEFVAIVGRSGSGKSTLLRLLLGFERAEFGTVLYDDQELAAINMMSLRRQVGVVLQNGSLMPGDIFSNIVGSTGASLEEAWEAARVAGIADEIKALPMDMHTVISEGASTISGGQRQRLMIARAVVGRPRVLFFDEATSALDAQTQDLVSQRIASLNTTRIVIAHRLSTIRKADRIYVLADHKIVASGTFEELLSQPGEFAELARRQMV